MSFLSSTKKLFVLSFITLFTALLFYSPLVELTRNISVQIFPREDITDNTSTSTPNTITTPDMSNFVPRAVAKVRPAIEQAEGMGARVRRSIGTMSVRNFTPFLMLDHFKVSPDAGFPDHPHRGQETITYMIKGNVDHEDFTGSAGTLGPGDLQFMTAGRGIVHAEMPRINKTEDGDIEHVEGLQLWVDLPLELKNCEPRYRDLKAAEIPIANPDPKIEVKVISGESYGVTSVQDLAYTPVWLLDFKVQPGGRVKQPVPIGFNTLVYVMSGDVAVGGKTYHQYDAIYFNEEGDGIEAIVPEDAKSGSQFFVIAGQILNQPIVQHGPFVETSREKIVQAFLDYQRGSNGFERAVGWESKIGARMLKNRY